MNKKSMSVTEMRKLLGIGKTDSYWLVKKGYFETVIIAGKMRVMVDSFEKWYDNQLHYRKVDGTPPGKNWTGITFSVREVAELLGVSDSSIYELIKKKVFRTVKVGQATRIYYKEAFVGMVSIPRLKIYKIADVHKGGYRRWRDTFDRDGRGLIKARPNKKSYLVYGKSSRYLA